MSKAIMTKKSIHSGEKTALPRERKSSGEGQGQYVESFAALIDKYVQYLVSGNGIPFCIILVVIGFIFIQDNRAGRLRNWEDLFWTIQKCSFPVALYLFYFAGCHLVRLIKKRHRATTNKL